MEDYYRRMQLTGDIDSAVSFSIGLSSFVAPVNVYNAFHPGSSDKSDNSFPFTNSGHLFFSMTGAELKILLG